MRNIYLPPQKGARLPLAHDCPDEYGPDAIPVYRIAWRFWLVALCVWIMLAAIALSVIRPLLLLQAGH